MQPDVGLRMYRVAWSVPRSTLPLPLTHGIGCFYTQRAGKTVLELRAFPRRLPLFECGSLCSCLASGLCAKRLCQSGITLKLVVRPSSGALGLGLFADQDVVKGEFVCLYSGERRTAAEAERIWTERQARGAGNYILALREWFGEGARQSVSSYIDPTLKGNVGRFASESPLLYALS